MIGKMFKGIKRPAPRKPAPRKPTLRKLTPVKPGGGTRGNVETNYRGIPGLVNATAPVPALGKKPTPSIPTPVTPPKPATGIRRFDDPKMVDNYLENVARAKADPDGSFNLPSKPATNIIGRGGIGMPAIDTSTNKTVLPSNPAGGVGTTGFKSGSGGFASSLFGHGAPAGGGATSVNTGMGPAPGRASFGMKKGGKVKAAKASAPKASSASKRGDGIATKGKTKGRMV